jgi:hypothetical protein
MKKGMNLIKKFSGIFIIINLLSLSQLVSQPLPDDFPGITTYKSGETAPGYIFLNVSTEVEGIGYYVMMIDDDGLPFKYKKLTAGDYSYDFKPQPCGLLSYAQFLAHHSYTGGGDCIHMVMDEEMNIVDSFQMGNGYIAEAHDFQWLPNGHALLFGYYLSEFDLSNIVEGGYPNAQVSGGIIQELDDEKNVVWQWRSWDYYDYHTFDLGNRADRQIVSQFHLNAISLDYDDNILLGTPSTSMKINRQTGEVMWVLGGDMNEFSFIGVDSTEGVSDVTGHTFHRLENGNILVYDNAPRSGGGTSVANEYSIDEENKTAEKIMTYTPDFDIAGWHRGSAQRLPNGNTLVGWGGANGDSIPTCTEFDSLGNQVLEVFFDNYDVESYRAVRHPYPPTTAKSAFETEVAAGNSYDFLQGDTLDTGVTIEVGSYTGDGYNEVDVQTYDYAPLYPEFPGRAPMVLAKKVMVETNYITSINGIIKFNADVFGIKNPEDITVYHREFANQGLLVPLTTSYNSVTGVISASFNRVGEFIFTYPDVEHIVYAPLPVGNAHGEKVNYEEPVQIEWAPKGFFDEFELEVSSAEDFSDIIVSDDGLKSTVFEISDLENNTDYYWRVKTTNQAGTSDWSDVGHFTAYKPYVQVNAPNGDEVWARGLDYFIEWESNIDDDLIIGLYKDHTLLQTIDTAANTNAYLWEIPTELDSTCGYYIKLTSINNPGVADFSDRTFSVSDSACSNSDVIISTREYTAGLDKEMLTVYPNPTQGKLFITLDIHEEGDVSVQLYTISGEYVETIYESQNVSGKNEITYDMSRLEPGLYLVGLNTGKQKVFRKVSLTP